MKLVDKKKIYRLLIYGLLVAGLLLIVFPYVWMILASFKPSEEIYRTFIPSRLTLDHYRTILLGHGAGAQNPFLKALINSLIVSSTTTVSVILFGAMAGYALAKLPFRGNQFFNQFILFQMLFPPVLFLIPRFLIILKFKLVNTYAGMFLPFMMSAWSIFLFNQFFKTIPDDLLDAARLDGCSELTIVFKMMLPLSKSVTVIVAVFTFMAMWDEFLWYLVVNKNYNLMPLSVLLGLFTKGEYEAYPGIQTAGATLLTLPILILFFIFRKYFSEGIAMTGLKA